MPAARRLKPSQASALGHPDVHVPHTNPWDKDDRSKCEMNRITAGQRRKQESESVSDLAKTLPFSKDVTSKLDRASVYRLVISYLRMRNLTEESEESYDAIKKHAGNRVEVFDHDKQIIGYNQKQQYGMNENDLMLDLLNGFVIFVSTKGKVLYVSQNVCQHLGLNQVDMIGHGAHTFIHPDDQGEVLKQLLVDNTDDESMVFATPMDEEPRAPCSRRFFYVRMKCFYLRKGAKSKQPGFMLVQWAGHLKMDDNDEPEGLVCVCRPLQPTPIVEIRMDGNMFMSRHSMDLKFTFCDQRIATLLGYEPEEIVGQNAYLFHNPVDAHLCSACHNDLMLKGSSMSKYYRFLSKSGKWVWMQTRASVICNTHNEPQYVVCMNYIVSEKEGQKSIEELAKQNSKPGSLSQYPNDTCNEPGFIEPFHSANTSGVESGDSSVSSPISDHYVSSPGSVFSSNDGSDENTSKRLRSNQYSSTSINGASNCQSPADMSPPMSNCTNDDINEARVTVHSLIDPDDIFMEHEHSTGVLSHTASDQMWPILNDLINSQANSILDEYGPDRAITHPDEELGPIFSPSPSMTSDAGWSPFHIAPIESIPSKNAANASRDQFGKLRSLFSQPGLNEIPPHRTDTPGKKMAATRIEHISPDDQMKRIASDIEKLLTSPNGLSHSRSCGEASMDYDHEPQLDEIFKSFGSGVTIHDGVKENVSHRTPGKDARHWSAPEAMTTSRKAPSRLEALLKSDQATDVRENVNFETRSSACTASRTNGNNNNNSPDEGLSILEGLLAGQVRPNEAHRVAVNESAPTYLSKSTMGKSTTRHKNKCSDEHCRQMGFTDMYMDTNSMDGPISDPTISSASLSLDDADACLNIPEYPDWRELLGPLSPRSQALVEEAESILSEVDRQETQTRDYWGFNS